MFCLRGVQAFETSIVVFHPDCTVCDISQNIGKTFVNLKFMFMCDVVTYRLWLRMTPLATLTLLDCSKEAVVGCCNTVGTTPARNRKLAAGRHMQIQHDEC